MATILPVTFGSPDPSIPMPSTLLGLIQVLRGLTSVALATASGTVGVVYTSATMPTSAQQGSVWLRLDGSGEMYGFYWFFNGRWCKIWGFPTGFIMHLRTDPTNLFNLTTGMGLFDAGTPGMAGDCYGWKLRLATDTSGVQAIDRVIMAADKWTGSNFSTTLPDGSTGHKGDTVSSDLNANQIPSLAITGREFDATGAASGTAATGAVARAVVSMFTKGADITTAPANSGAENTAQEPLSSIPPFVSFGLMEWVGQFYTDAAVQTAN